MGAGQGARRLLRSGVRMTRIDKAIAGFADAARELFSAMIEDGKTPWEASEGVKKAFSIGGDYLLVERESRFERAKEAA